VAAATKIRHIDERADWFVPMVAGASLAVSGGVLASIFDWSSASYWGIALVASTATTGLLVRHWIKNPEAAAPRTRTRSLQPDAVVALIGHSGSGKSRLANFIAEHNPDWAVASCGQFVLAEAKSRGVPNELTETHAFGERLVEELGAEKFVEAVLDHGRVPKTAKFLLIDDVYHESVYKALSRFGQLHNFRVDLSEAARRASLEDRGLNPSNVAAIEHSGLTHEVERLLADIPPERSLQGVSNDRDLAERATELESLVEAA